MATVGSGQTYATLAAWVSGEADGLGGTYSAECTGHVGNCLIDGFGAGATITIAPDIGEKFDSTGPTSGAWVGYAGTTGINLDTLDAVDLTIEDMGFFNQGPGESGTAIEWSNPVSDGQSLRLDRVWVYHFLSSGTAVTRSQGFVIDDASFSGSVSLTVSNSIFEFRNTSTTNEAPFKVFTLFALEPSSGSGTITALINNNTFICDTLETDPSSAHALVDLRVPDNASTLNFANNVAIDVQGTVTPADVVFVGLTPTANTNNATSDTSGQVTGIDTSVFENYGNRDYTPANNGALHEAASATYAPSLDIFDVSRPQDTSDDIGAVEREEAAAGGGGVGMFKGIIGNGIIG